MTTAQDETAADAFTPLPQEPTPPPGRPTCLACARPARVCLCAAFPPTPHALAGRVIILQHPREAGRPKATVPLLEKCVRPVTVCVGRVFSPSVDASAAPSTRWPPALAAALADAAAGLAPLFVLWPGWQGAVDLEQAVRQSGFDGGSGRPSYSLLAIDGTWRQAREMWGSGGVRAWATVSPGVWVVRAGPAPTPAPGALFVEPGGGCVTTAEAVAAGLVRLEPGGAAGPGAVAAAVVAATASAAFFNPAIAARVAQAASASGGRENE
jgi:hypothetical protein